MAINQQTTNRAAAQGAKGRRTIIRGFLVLQNLHRRFLAAVFCVIGPAASYWISAVLARGLYRLLDPLRRASEAQCRAALAGRIDRRDVAPLAERAFVHRIWNLVDLMLAERYLHPGTYRRFGGRIDEGLCRRLLDAQRRRQPVILVTGYYGPYDLLPLFLGYHGVRAAAVYRPHENPAYDRLRQRVRVRGGWRMVPMAQATDRLPEILEAGGTVALVADHHADRRGLAATFLGLPTRAMRTVGLLAWRYQADIIVAGIRRLNNEFRFELVVADVLEHDEWRHLADPVETITHRYLRGLEKIILDDPSQYLWANARWGTEVLTQLQNQ